MPKSGLMREYVLVLAEDLRAASELANRFAMGELRYVDSESWVAAMEIVDPSALEPEEFKMETFRLSETHRETLRAAAEREGTTKTDVIRRMLDEIYAA